jgi:hypothetical protein
VNEALLSNRVSTEARLDPVTVEEASGNSELRRPASRRPSAAQDSILILNNHRSCRIPDVCTMERVMSKQPVHLRFLTPDLPHAASRVYTGAIFTQSPIAEAP